MVRNAFNDFVLFPQREGPFLDFAELSKPQDIFQALSFDMNADYQPELLGSEAPNYECFPTTAVAYSSRNMSYFDASHLAMNEQKGSFLPTASTSPPSSLSHSLDHAPSNVSHASGASGQSTASSTVGSPYSQTTQGIPAGQDQWIVASNGLGIASGLASSDAFSGAYHPFSPEADHLTFEDKFAGSFVGEFTQVPRHFTPFSSSNSSPTSYSPSSHSQILSSPKSFPLNVEHAVSSNQSIDTILEESDSAVTDPLPWASSSPSYSTRHSPLVRHRKHTRQSTEDPVEFKSPTAPASSAMSTMQSGFAVPNTTYEMDPPRASHKELAKHQHHHHLASAPSSPIYSSRSHFQSPFFTQSSGSFVAPLESSCWFSLLPKAFISRLLF